MTSHVESEGLPAPVPGATSSARQAAAAVSRTPRQPLVGASPQAAGAEKSFCAIRRGGLFGVGDRSEPTSALNGKKSPRALVECQLQKILNFRGGW